LRKKTYVISLAVAFCFVLTGCGSSAAPGSGAPAGTDSSSAPPTANPAVEPRCPAKLKSSFDYNGPNTEADFSVVARAFGIDLPAGGCVILTPGNADGTSHFEIFWPGKDQNFANIQGNALVAAGAAAYGDPIDYKKGDSDMVLYWYPAGDGMHWSDSFEGSPQLVVGEGVIPNAG
jgi:hypothetical protein